MYRSNRTDFSMAREDYAALVEEICDLVANDSADRASEIAKARWPFASVKKTPRKRSPSELLQLWMRDGFIDRYGGERLVDPGVLRLLSILLPSDFPYHPNWRTDQCHLIHWKLHPTHDHVIPISRGGADQDENLVTTSMVRNSAKAHWTLEELEWELVPPGKLSLWDGLMVWYVSFLEQEPQLMNAHPSLERWYTLATKCANA